jgi:hypothetical protein
LSSTKKPGYSPGMRAWRIGELCEAAEVFDLAQFSRAQIFLSWQRENYRSAGGRRMSLDEVRACYRLYAAYYTSCGIGPYRRMLTSLVQLRHSISRNRLRK